MQIHTQSVHFTADKKLIAFIEKKLEKLNIFYDRIIEATVVMKLENSGQVRDKIAEVRLKLPGNILIAKESSKSFEAAIDQAAVSLKRQLVKYKERLRA